jgi:hypothetical protein
MTTIAPSFQYISFPYASQCNADTQMMRILKSSSLVGHRAWEQNRFCFPTARFMTSYSVNLLSDTTFLFLHGFLGVGGREKLIELVEVETYPKTAQAEQLSFKEHSVLVLCMLMWDHCDFLL